MNEFERSTIIRTFEHFRSYSWVILFKVVSDHKALPIDVKNDRSRKTQPIQLTYLMERHLFLEFQVLQGRGRAFGITEHWSWNPHSPNERQGKSNTLGNELSSLNAAPELKNLKLKKYGSQRDGHQPAGVENRNESVMHARVTARCFQSKRLMRV